MYIAPVAAAAEAIMSAVVIMQIGYLVVPDLSASLEKIKPTAVVIEVMKTTVFSFIQFSDLAQIAAAIITAATVVL